ncbi:MAG: hypothetical protein JXR77_14640 [Lentisphaeria bacterium]|nr:hypothetical protein [Lentisphaeria bacterium]
MTDARPSSGKLIGLLLRTDCRHLRGWLAAHGLCGAALLLANQARLPVGLAEVLPSLVLVLLTVAGVLVVFLAVQADGLSGSTAHWLGRPVRRVHLFVAKSALLGLGVIGPVLLALGAGWVANGIRGGMLPAALAGAGLWLCALTLICAAIAGATPGLMRGLPLIFGFGAAAMAGGMLVSILSAPGSRMVPQSLTASRTVIAAVFLLTAGLAAWLWQALRGSPGVTLTVLAVGAVLLAPATAWWPVDFLRPTALQPPPLDVSVDPTPTGRAGAGEQVLFSRFRVTGLPPDHLVAVADVRAVLSRREGPSLSLGSGMSAGHPGRLPAPIWATREAHEFAAFLRRRLPERTTWQLPNSFPSEAELPIQEAEGVVWSGGPPSGHLQGELVLAVHRIDLLADVPLACGTVYRGDGRVVAVDEVKSTEAGIEVWAHSFRAGVVLTRDPRKAAHGPIRWGWTETPVFVVYNPRTQEALAPDWRQHARGSLPTLSAVRGGYLHRHRFAVPYSPARARLSGVPLEEWRRDLRLLVFRDVYRGSVTRTVDVPSYRLQWDSGAAERAAGLAAIEALPFPEVATDAQVDAYLDTIFRHAPDGFHGPETAAIRAKLERIGEGGVPRLLARLPVDERLYQAYDGPVLRKLATPAHLGDLCAALRRDAKLADVFAVKGWEEEGGRAVLALLADGRVPMGPAALRLAARVAQPQDYAPLADRFVGLERGQEALVPVLEELPGFDLESAVRRAWRRALVGWSEATGLAAVAAAYGLPGAFDEAVLRLDDPTMSEAGRARLLTRLRALTAGEAEGEELQRWLLANLGRFRYNPAAARYDLDPSPGPPVTP